MYKQLDAGEITTAAFLHEYHSIIRETYTDRLAELTNKCRKLEEEISRVRSAPRTFALYDCDGCVGTSELSGGTSKLSGELDQVQNEVNKLQGQYNAFCKQLDENLPLYISILEKKATVQDEPFMRFLFKQKDRLASVQRMKSEEQLQKLKAANTLVLNYERELGQLKKEQKRVEAAFEKAKQELIKQDQAFVKTKQELDRADFTEFVKDDEEQ